MSDATRVVKFKADDVPEPAAEDRQRLKEAADQPDEVLIRQALSDPDNPPLTERQLVRAARGQAITADPIGLLRHHREARGLSLAEVAERSGIDKSRLSRLENDPSPNPTLSTLMRIADAIGVRLTLGIVEKDAA